MNTDPNNGTPTPDPFEALAQQLATIAAMLVQTAGQIAALRPGAQTPPPPPPQESEPEQSPEAEPQPEPEKDEPEPPKEPQDTDEGEETTEDQPPAESPANEQDEGNEPPESDSGETTDQSGEDGEPQETEDGKASDNAQEPAGEQDGEPNDSEPQESEDSPEGAESTEAGEGSEDGETQDSPDTDGGEPGEHDDQPAEEEPTEPEHVDSDNDIGEGSGHDADEETGMGNAENDGKGEMAALPPDLPPLDSTLANCSPPPPPDAVPYRPLSPTARKVADLLTGALGKRFALPRPDRATGALSASAIARHAPDVFTRRPRRDGHRPKLTIISDTSGSMSCIHKDHGADLLDGLLEAHRRRVIDLRLYNSYLASGSLANARDGFDKSGQFQEPLIKKNMADSDALMRHFTAGGVVQCNGGAEGFAKALVNLKPVIRDSDATILFTDGHWTDGALDKVAYQCEGIQVVGLYIPLELKGIRKEKTKMIKIIDAMPESQRAAATAAMTEFESLAGEAMIAEQEGQKANQAYTAASIRQHECRANKAADAEAESAAKAYEAANEKCAEALQKAKSKLTGSLTRHGEHILNYGLMVAAAKAALEMNSHRSYCVESAVECAQAIAQEIVRQIESK